MDNLKENNHLNILFFDNALGNVKKCKKMAVWNKWLNLKYRSKACSLFKAPNLAWITKTRSCFVVNVFIWSTHFIPVIYSILFHWMWKALLQTEHQVTLPNTHIISVPHPMGLQLGAAVSFNICVGTGNGSSTAYEHCSPFKTGRTHWSLMHTGDKKTQQPGSWGMRRQAEEADKSWSQLVPNPYWQRKLFYPSSLLMFIMTDTYADPILKMQNNCSCSGFSSD